MALFAKKYLARRRTLLASSVAGAQAAPAKPTCDVGESATGNAARATLSVNLAREAHCTRGRRHQPQERGEAARDRRDGRRTRSANAYVLGEALSLWANQPGMGLTPNSRHARIRRRTRRRTLDIAVHARLAFPHRRDREADLHGLHVLLARGAEVLSRPRQRRHQRA